MNTKKTAAFCRTDTRKDGSALLPILSRLPEHLSVAILGLLERDRISGDAIEEIRLRRERASALTTGGRSLRLPTLLSAADLRECFRLLSGGSVYAVAETVKDGFFSLPGGYRVGVVGRAVCDGRRVTAVTDVGSIVIRIPHAVSHAADKTEALFRRERRGILLFSPPGVGKTTALRSLAARLSTGNGSLRVAVIDEREEFAPLASLRGAELDLLFGYPKADGILLAARTLSPELMIADEIGDDAECRALLSVSHLGVPLIASAHAREASELFMRPALRNLIESGAFPYLVGLSRDGDRLTEHIRAAREVTP